MTNGRWGASTGTRQGDAHLNVFELREHLVGEYGEYVGSFIRVLDPRVSEHVQAEFRNGVLWPDPLIQLNPSFARGSTIDALVDGGTLHEECRRIFRRKPSPTEDLGTLHLHRHQTDAVHVARDGHDYVLTTGTGSGKSLAYIIPIVDRVLRTGPGKGIQAIVVSLRK